MRFNHQLRESLYRAGYVMSPEAKRLEVEENIKRKETKRNDMVLLQRVLLYRNSNTK